MKLIRDSGLLQAGDDLGMLPSSVQGCRSPKRQDAPNFGFEAHCVLKKSVPNGSFFKSRNSQSVKSSSHFKLEISGKVTVGRQMVLSGARSHKEADKSAVLPSFL